MSVEQAVILCGGLGSRLRPLTIDKPKPMVEVNGKPFLHYLIHQLSQIGISKFLLLVGYKQEKIIEYFGDGSKFGLTIEYSRGYSNWTTAKRIWEAKDNLEEEFYLLYGDNYATLYMDELLEMKSKHNSVITLGSSEKQNGNLRFLDDGLVTEYDRIRSDDSLTHVEIGYMLVSKNRFLSNFVDIDNLSGYELSHILEIMAENGEISTVLSKNGYLSISDRNRLQITSEYFLHKKIILLDRDGVINKKKAPGQYVTSLNDFEFIDKNIDFLSKLSSQGFRFIIITNQACISLGLLTTKELESLHEEMITQLKLRNIKIEAIYYSPHHWNENSFLRKPNPGMFFQAAKDFKLLLESVLYIGDDYRDYLAAKNAGCGFIYLNECEEQMEFDNLRYNYFLTNDLNKIFDEIIKFYQEVEELHG